MSDRSLAVYFSLAEKIKWALDEAALVFSSNNEKYLSVAESYASLLGASSKDSRLVHAMYFLPDEKGK
jgi:hypothetical protein